MNLPNASYCIDCGPVDISKLEDNFEELNCRLAIQLYFHAIHHLDLSPEKILCPLSYRNLGTVVEQRNGYFFDELLPGDIIFAERIRNKKREKIDNSIAKFEKEDDWITALHSAIYLGTKNKNHLIWHATSIEGKSCIWSTEKFELFYKPVLARRVISN